jgi:hypothetical protein
MPLLIHLMISINLRIDRMKGFFLIVIVTSGLYACSPRSYCFFNVKERTLYISDKQNDSIKSVTVSSENPSLNFKKVFNINPAVKSFQINADSVINQSVHFRITTRSHIWYSLDLKKEDWAKDTLFKCRHLIK